MKKLLLPLVAVAFLAGCGDDLPSESAGTEIAKSWHEQSKCQTFVKFSKTDGQAMEFGGIKSYRMMYDASIELKPDCVAVYDPKGKRFSYGSSPRPLTPGEVVKAGSAGTQVVKGGETVIISGVLLFVKSEKGWRGKVDVF